MQLIVIVIVSWWEIFAVFAGAALIVAVCRGRWFKGVVTFDELSVETGDRKEAEGEYPFDQSEIVPDVRVTINVASLRSTPPSGQDAPPLLVRPTH